MVFLLWLVNWSEMKRKGSLRAKTGGLPRTSFGTFCLCHFRSKLSFNRVFICWSGQLSADPEKKASRQWSFLIHNSPEQIDFQLYQQWFRIHCCSFALLNLIVVHKDRGCLCLDHACAVFQIPMASAANIKRTPWWKQHEGGQRFEKMSRKRGLVVSFVRLTQ